MLFEVCAPSDQVLMTADRESTPYDVETMLDILNAGYVIKVDGKRVAKSAVKALGKRSGGVK